MVAVRGEELNKSTHEALHRERIEEQLAPTPVEAAREGALPAVAGEIANAVNAPRRKLAKEHLEDLLEIAVGCVAHYQPCVLSGTPNANENLDRFKDWFRIASDLAMKLAHFQSPTYRAIAVMAACEASVRPPVPQLQDDFEMDPATRAQQAYLRLIRDDPT